MADEEPDRTAELEHLISLGKNVIAFITNSVDMLNRTYFAINLANNAKALAWGTSKAISAISDAPQEFLDLLQTLKSYSDEMAQQLEERAGWLELPSDGLPLLHATQLIGVWGALESFVGDVFKASIKYRRDLLEGKAFEKISLPVGLIAKRADDLYSTIYQRVLPPGSGQIGKLEDVLNMVGLGGPIDPDLRRNLLSAHQIRNVWAHNVGLVDAHFVEQCPYLGYEIGDVVELSADRFGELNQAILDYVTVILGRIHDRGFDQQGA
ncbi:hypothetical protein ACIBG0_10520 [Nocardia sp. NPDC050630]|uniref:hypothetical protein n=1 Tax=Nocardia sp. NPDC050630 TaxID=3364321 RepID=UPI0037BCD636